VQATETFGPYEIDTLEPAEGPVQHAVARRLLGEEMVRPCRLRRLDLQYAEDPETQLRLLDEARLVIGLRHPGIIATHDYGVIDGELYLEDELVEGTTLARLLTRYSPLDQGVAVLMCCRLAEVLTYVHTARGPGGSPLKLIHRNLVPRHVHITLHGETKLSGFGMAHFRGRLMRTSLGSIRDTVGYVSPEDVMGQPLTRRSDLFGLGILLYEMVTGRVPFQANNVAEARDRVMQGEHPMPRSLRPDLSPRVSDLIEHLLQPLPEDRPGTAAEVWEKLWQLWRQVGQPRDETWLRSVVAAIVRG
jgi:eukaryotic-like serine/threonine-protein kinase